MVDDDRTEKLRIYAAAGAPECWIVNIPLRAIEVCKNPRGGAYDSVSHFSAGQRAGLGEFTDVAVDVAELFATAPLP